MLNAFIGIDSVRQFERVHTAYIFMIRIRWISLNICFLELSEKTAYGLKNEFESAPVNEPSVFIEILRLKQALKDQQRCIIYNAAGPLAPA